MNRLPLHIKRRHAGGRDYSDLLLGIIAEIVQEGGFPRPCLAGKKHILPCIFQQVKGFREFTRDPGRFGFFDNGGSSLHHAIILPDTPAVHSLFCVCRPFWRAWE